MPLSTQQKKHYRAIGHKLKPVVTVAGNGLTSGVIEETRRALADHELIKVKVQVEDREAKKALISELSSTCGAEVANVIGNTALLLKRSVEPNPHLSNILRNEV